jgi:hypothetical protein
MPISYPTIKLYVVHNKMGGRKFDLFQLLLHILVQSFMYLVHEPVQTNKLVL